MTYIQIIVACKENNLKNLETLLLQPYVMNIINKKDSKGKTALHYACSFGHTQCIQLLLDYGTNLNSEDDDGQTPLMKAIQGNHIESIRKLLENGADTSVVDYYGRNAQDYATSGDILFMIENTIVLGNYVLK